MYARLAFNWWHGTERTNEIHTEHWALNVQITNIGIKQLLEPFNWTRNRWLRIVHSLLTKRLQCCSMLVFFGWCVLLFVFSFFLSRMSTYFVQFFEQLRETVQKLTQRVTVTSLFKSFLHFILFYSLVFCTVFQSKLSVSEQTSKSSHFGCSLVEMWVCARHGLQIFQVICNEFPIKATNRLVSIDLNGKIWYATP